MKNTKAIRVVAKPIPALLNSTREEADSLDKDHTDRQSRADSAPLPHFMKEKETESKFGIFREDLGMATHTALRKVCDSSPTSLAWNLINLEGITPAWKEYLEILWSIIKALKKKPDDYGPILKQASESLEWGNHGQACLKLTFRFFDDGDWSGMAAFLGES